MVPIPNKTQGKRFVSFQTAPPSPNVSIQPPISALSPLPSYSMLPLQINMHLGPSFTVKKTSQFTTSNSQIISMAHPGKTAYCCIQNRLHQKMHPYQLHFTRD
eukprot:7787043-Ditylum_brightwellii.AAC.1